MATPVYERVRLFWGAVDVIVASGSYTSAQQVSLGASAAAGSGVGARRAQLVFARTAPGTFAEDVAVMHFDFVNYTSGSPDDTWTAGDFTTMDGLLTAWWNAVKPNVHTSHTLREIRYYRIGSGVTVPNPPEHIASINSPGTSGSAQLPPQCATAISFHVAPRRSWGRTYLPGLTTAGLGTGGTNGNAMVDAIAAATDTLANSSSTNDYKLSVFSKHLSSMLSVEGIAVDNIVDIIRRRRWEHPTYRKQLP
jgi:hypothetical protein